MLINGKSYFLLVLFLFVSLFLLKDNYIFSYSLNYIVVIHELCHALMTIFTGGSVHSISLNSNGGTTISSGGVFILISLAGYIGTTLIGSLLIYFSNNTKKIEYLLKLLSITIFVIYLINYHINFNVQLITLVLINIIVFTISYLEIRNIFALILGNLLILNSFNDVKIYLFNTNIIYQTDAGILARYFGSEIFTFPIALSIFIINIFILYVLFKKLINK